MTAGTDLKIDIWLRHFQLIEEDLRHVGVVVLPRVNKSLLKLLAESSDLPQHRSGFDEIGPSAYNMENSSALRGYRQ